MSTLGGGTALGGGKPSPAPPKGTALGSTLGPASTSTSSAKKKKNKKKATPTTATTEPINQQDNAGSEAKSTAIGAPKTSLGGGGTPKTSLGGGAPKTSLGGGTPSSSTSTPDATQQDAAVENGGAAAKKKKKKKKVKAPEPEPPASKAGDAKKGPAGRRGLSKAMAAKILAAQEEQKRLEEEAKRKAEEDERKEKERLIEEEKRRVAKEKQKRLDKERQKILRAEAAIRDKEKKRLQVLARLGSGVTVSGVSRNSPPTNTISSTQKIDNNEITKESNKVISIKDKEEVEDKNKQKEKKKEEEDNKDDNNNIEEKEKEEEEEDDDDDWESKLDDELNVDAFESKKEKVHLEKNQKEVTSSSSSSSSKIKGKEMNEDNGEGESEEVKGEKEKEKVEGSKKKQLRSPICCILGHVDTGKTKLLDKIRHTNVQGGEAGGITQQIGATYFPLETLKEKTKELMEKFKFEIRVPGLLIIDTPGHESFTNLRSRGSSLCDIAILVIDMTHGLEPQTIESLKLLKQRKTPFVVALNKVDRLFSWKSTPNAPIRSSLAKQTKSVLQEFETRVTDTIVQLAEQELNATLYYKNKNFNEYVSLVPTSALTGEGIPDLLALLVQLCQTRMSAKIATLSTFQATVLEVKMVEGLGTTIDVILSNGILYEGDRIVICGLDGPIATTIRALLTPHPLRELRVKTPYMHHKEVRAAQGVKISAPGLERAVAGSSLLVVRHGDDENQLKQQVQGEFTDMLKKVSKHGVCVQASTLGSMEALLTFLKSSSIPVGAINLGPVHRSDIIRASVSLENGGRPEYGTILAFDVKITRDARDEAQRKGVRIFSADIIYHLFDQFTAFVDEIKAKERAEAMEKVIFPVSLQIVPDCIFNQKDPIVVGVRVKEGILKIGTPICVIKTNEEDNSKGKKIVRFLGKVTSIQEHHKDIEEAEVDHEVAIKLEGAAGMCFGRHFELHDELLSQVSRESIDALKEYYRDLLKSNRDLVKLVLRLKPMFGIL